MENNSNKLDKLMKFSIIAGVLIVALSIAYYLIIILPKKQEINIRKDCADTANKRATELLKTKANLPGGDRFKEASKKDLLLKGDYDSYYENCLSENGLKR